jgi:hypothetical protein
MGGRPGAGFFTNRGKEGMRIELAEGKRIWMRTCTE